MELPLPRLTSLQGVTRKTTLRSKRPLLLAPSNRIHHPSTRHKYNLSNMRHLRRSNNNTKAYAHTTLQPPLPKHRFLTRTHTHTTKAHMPPHPLSSSNPVPGPYTHPSDQQGYTTSSRIRTTGTSRTSVSHGLYGLYEICHTLITYAIGKLTVSKYENEMIFTCTVAVVAIMENLFGHFREWVCVHLRALSIPECSQVPPIRRFCLRRDLTDGMPCDYCLGDCQLSVLFKRERTGEFVAHPLELSTPSLHSPSSNYCQRGSRF